LKQIEDLAQGLIATGDPSTHNQAMMELGATLCTPKSPTCLICPVRPHCLSYKNDTVLLRPVKKKNKQQEPWLWTMNIFMKNGKIALTKDNGTPWLKNTWVFPGQASKIKSVKPKKWDLKHSITKHDIFVVLKKPKSIPKSTQLRWILPQDISSLGVSSVVKKALHILEKRK